jgi:hypothetical protein
MRTFYMFCACGFFVVALWLCVLVVQNPGGPVSDRIIWGSISSMLAVVFAVLGSFLAPPRR